MSHFIETSRGLLNLDAVAWIERADRRVRGQLDIVHMQNGEVLHCEIVRYAHDMDMRQITARVIAVSPVEVLVVHCPFFEKRPEDKSEIVVAPNFIVGWRDCFNHMEPVLADAFYNYENDMILLPCTLERGYRVLASVDRYWFDTLEEAREYVLRDEQLKWDVGTKIFGATAAD